MFAAILSRLGGRRLILAWVMVWIAGRGSGEGTAQAASLMDPVGLEVTSVAQTGPLRWEVVLEIPEGLYAVVYRAASAAGPWSAFAIGLPDATGMATVESVCDPEVVCTFFRGEGHSLRAPADNDGDGLDDLFEVQFPAVLNPLDADDGMADGDGDGWSNRAEYARGTDPQEAEVVESRRFPSLRFLRENPPRLIPAQVYLAGFESEGDGWGGWFAWRKGDSSAGDDAVVVSLGDERAGRLVRELQPEDPVVANWWRPASDGSAYADDALRKAVSFLAGRVRKKLLLLPGRYRVAAYPTGYTELNRAPLYLSGLEDFEVEGTGAVLFSEEDGDLMVMENCRYGRVSGIRFEGPGSDRLLSGLHYACVNLHGYGSDLVFERCQFLGFMHGISHLFGEKTTTRVTIRECLFRDGGHSDYLTLGVDGAAVSGIGSGWTIENCTFDECARGVEIENVGRWNPISQVMVRGNRMTNIREMGIMSFMGNFTGSDAPQSDLVIKDNVLVGKRPRHRRAGGEVIPVRPISLAGGVRCLVRGNVCRDGDYSGISLMAVDADFSDATISENIVEDFGGRGIQVYSRSGYVARDVQVVNNRVSRCADRGILVRGENIFVRGNIVDVVAEAGIHLEGLLDAPSETSVLWVRDNLVREVLHGAPAILVDATVKHVLVTGNDLAVAEIGIRDRSRSVVAGNNRFVSVVSEMVSE